MKTTLKQAAEIVVLAAFASGSGIFGISVPVMAQMQSGGGNTAATTSDMPMGMGEGGSDMMMHGMMANHKWGIISSIQNNQQGQPTWIVAGHWMMEIGSAQNGTAAANITGSISNIIGFHAMLHKMMLNGSSYHTHEISNFTQTGDPTFDSDTNSTTITGTATITIAGSPVPNVPTTIQIAQDKVIAITPDPAAIGNHFGNTPIYGIVAFPEMMQDMMMKRYGGGGGGDNMHMMNMTGMSSGMMQGPMDDTMMMNSSSGGM
jgi:hypothetical protein